MVKAAKIGILLSICFILTFALAAQTGTQAVDQARVLYNGGSYKEAFKLLSDKIPVNAEDANLKKSAAALLIYMGLSEYDLRNYRNAYECFSRAENLQPGNALAGQYLRKMETEMNVAALKNEGEAGTAGQTDGQASQISPTDLQSLISKVWAEEEELSKAEKTEAYAKENSELKAQIEQQRSLNQETIDLLKRIAEKQSSPQIIVQSDPSLQALTAVMGDQTKILKSGSWTSILTIIALIVLGVIILGAMGLFVVLVIRARRPRPGLAPEPFAGFAGPALPGVGPEMLSSPERPLLEYVQAEPGSADEAEIQKLTLRAGRLTRMIEEAKLGGKGWDAIRAYLDELDGELKADILQLVEDKIEHGELLSNQAVLPIIFPFLTDYDDYLRDRAEKAAAAALLEGESGEAVEAGPFELKNLLQIPEKLKTVLIGRDQSLATAKLSRSIARQLGFSAADCQSLYKAAIAHDAGYLMLDGDRLQEILRKPELTDEEFSLIKSHTLKGPEYFGGRDIPDDIRDAMLYHHERNDGSGYPNGLKKDQIPLFARVIGVAESFTALMASRPHRDKLEMGNALAIIRDARSKFDHDIVEALSAVVKSGGVHR